MEKFQLRGNSDCQVVDMRGLRGLRMLNSLKVGAGIEVEFGEREGMEMGEVLESLVELEELELPVKLAELVPLRRLAKLKRLNKTELYY